MSLHFCDDQLGGFPLIKAVTSLIANTLQGLSQIRLFEYGTHGGCYAVTAEVDTICLRIFGQTFRGRAQIEMQSCRDFEPFFRQIDCRLNHGFEIE